ncbi:hypothetical protein C5E46_19680 [Nocardia nova]|nr:hypothetical protein C5E46_19680 [Nocardia nova]
MLVPVGFHGETVCSRRSAATAGHGQITVTSRSALSGRIDTDRRTPKPSRHRSIRVYVRERSVPHANCTAVKSRHHC